CKKKIEKSIITLKDNKVKYAINKLLETTGDMPYAYNGYGYLDDLSKINVHDIEDYYNSVIKNDIADVYVVGNVDNDKIKNIFREYFKVTTYHKNNIDIITGELKNTNKVFEYRENDKVNQTQLTILCNLRGLTDKERKYVLPVYSAMLGGSANSILFDAVREKNSYAYYVNSVVKSYDNVLIIYSGIEKGNEKNVFKIIEKTLNSIRKGHIPLDKFNSAKETIISAIRASLDNPMDIITNYYAKELVDSPDVDERIINMNKVSVEDIVNVSKKINIHTMFILEDNDEEDND
ncbi:MAG: insulinase family protein, partial [Bacilli bacterium]|nr:insulinase family protein [Bacilli bacterium]